MIRFISTLVAATALAIAALGSVAAVDYGAACYTPEIPEGYICRMVVVTLEPGADIEEVLARTVGDVEHMENLADVVLAQGEDPHEMDYRVWTVLLAEGDDALEAIDVLLADPDVEDANWGSYGELTGGQTRGTMSGGGAETLPDTAMPATAPITLIGVMLLLAGGSLALRRRLA
jgi:hypothetical protein